MKTNFDHPDFDFVKEFRKLYLKSPCCGAYTRASENCPYGDIVVVSKNCYMCFNCGQSEDCCYCENSRALTDSYDCGYSEQCELCYECIDCDGCYNCNFCQDCSNCESIYFGFDLRRCKDCIGCSGLRDKQYCIFNEQLSKEDYQKKATKLDFENKTALKFINGKLEELKLKTPHVYSHQHDTADCTGDYVYHSKNCHMCFDARHSEDSAFVVMANLDRGTRDSFDCGPMPTGMDLCYDISYAHYLFNCRHIYFCGNLKDSEYCNNCFESGNLFGCCYLTKKQGKFFILNEEVDEDFYRKKTEGIIADLYARGIWSFHDLVHKDLSQKFQAVPDDQLKRICQICGESFEIIKREIDYYKKYKIPYPIYCPSCRMNQRINLRNEWKLYKRICDHCKKNIISTYTPDTKHTVYCFECYWGEMG